MKIRKVPKEDRHGQISGKFHPVYSAGSLLQYRELFLARLPVREYPTGHIFNMVGLPVGTLYFLVEGSVEIYTANRYGYVRLIGIHEVNTLFNLDSLSGMGSQEAVITARAARSGAGHSGDYGGDCPAGGGSSGSVAGSAGLMWGMCCG